MRIEMSFIRVSGSGALCLPWNNLVPRQQHTDDSRVENALKQASERDPGIERWVLEPSSKAEQGQAFENHDREPEPPPVAVFVHRLSKNDEDGDPEANSEDVRAT